MTGTDDLRVRLGKALPEDLQPVGAGLRYGPMFGGMLTGYGEQIVDALLPVVREACVKAWDAGYCAAGPDIAHHLYDEDATPNPWREAQS